MKKKRILTICAAGLIALLCVWRLWPRTLNDILDIDEDLFSTITVQVSEFGVSNGSPYIDIYRLDIPSAEDDNYAPVMSMIQNTKFRSDFRNLLQWDVVSVGSGADKITHSANVMLTWGDSNETCYISFHGDRVVSFDISGKTEFLVYHPTKRKTLNELAVFIKENGVLQE